MKDVTIDMAIELFYDEINRLEDAINEAETDEEVKILTAQYVELCKMRENLLILGS